MSHSRDKTEHCGLNAYAGACAAAASWQAALVLWRQAAQPLTLATWSRLWWGLRDELARVIRGDE